MSAVEDVDGVKGWLSRRGLAAALVVVAGISGHALGARGATQAGGGEAVAAALCAQRAGLPAARGVAPGPAGDGERAARAEPSAEDAERVAKTREVVHGIIAGVLARGTYDEPESVRVRSLLAALPPRERGEELAPLLGALNQGSVKVTFRHMPPF